MSKASWTATGLALAAVIAVASVLLLGGDDSAAIEPREGTPTVVVIEPRNGSVQQNRAVVVRVDVSNFQLNPRSFGKVPLLGEGHIRFSLNRIPNCVRPEAIERALNSPTSAGRLVGKSFDEPKYAGPNGELAARIGSNGLYSPATQPQIYYSRLPPGFYRLVVSLAQNDGSPTDGRAVTTFEIIPNARQPRPLQQDCTGKIPAGEVLGG